MYVVMEKNPEIPVFTIKPEVGNGREKKVHRNNIMNCNYLNDDEVEEETSRESEARRKNKGEKKMITVEPPENDEDEVTDSDEDEIVIVSRKPVSFEAEGERDIRETEENNGFSSENEENLEEESLEEENLEEENLEEEIPVRRSRRQLKKPSILTHDKMGGNPVMRHR